MSQPSQATNAPTSSTSARAAATGGTPPSVQALAQSFGYNLNASTSALRYAADADPALWTTASVWPNHPALLPPLPRESRASQFESAPQAQPDQLEQRATRTPAPVRRGARESRETRENRDHRETREAPARETRVTTPRPATRSVYRTPTPTAYAPATDEPTRERSRHATRHSMSPATSGDARPIYPAMRAAQTHTRGAQARAGVTTFPVNLDWPSNFDDWMIDIMRRRALRLNSGARRRGAVGSVRAVELAHIMEQSRDEHGHWICAICKLPVTLDELSFDHIVALADGGEHAAYNLAPAHRKCNEIKGSEKAQYRAQSLDRWLTEWSNNGHAPGVGPALAAAPTESTEQRYA